MSKAPSTSIRSLLLAIIAIVALPCVGIIIYSGLQLRDDALDDARELTQGIADRITSEQQNMMAGAEQLLSSLAQIPEVTHQDVDRMQRLLTNLLGINPQYVSLFVTDRNGNVLCSAVPLKSAISVADRRNFKNAMATGRFSSGEFLFSRTANRPTINYAYPYRNDGGELAGVIVVAFKLEYYSKIMEQAKLPHNSGLLLTDHAGMIIFSSFDSTPKAGEPLRNDLYKQMAEGPAEYSGFINSMHGDKRIISYRKLHLKGESTPYMYVRVGIPYDEALAAANTKLFDNVALLSSFLIMAIALALVTSKYLITNRISLLTEATRRFAAGDRHIRIAEQINGGELGILGKSFDQMVEKIQQQEQELCESEDRFRTYIINSPHAIFVCNENGRYVEVNPASCIMTGYDEEELLTMSLPDLLPPESMGWLSIRFQEVLETGHTSGEAAFRRKNGEIGYWSLAGVKLSPSKCIGFMTDITERKRTEEELITSEENYRCFTGLTSDYVHKCSRTGTGPYRVQWIGGAICAISGYSPEEIYELGCWLPLVHPDDRQTVTSHLFSMVPGDLKQIEFRMVTKEGQTRWIAEKSRCEAGKMEGELVLFGSSTDITERRRAEEERQNIEQQLLHAQKLESLGVLAGGIAHDFNNILVVIIGNADLALMRINKESPAVDNLHNIEQAASRAADLAKQMLAYSGKGRFVVESTDLSHLLEEMLHMLEVSISKKSVLRLNLHQPLPAVEADATQMRQIVMNLVINASEAIGDRSGVIAITTGCMDCDRGYLKNVWLDENISEGLYVYLEITDTGCGMDKETMAKIFDPFFTTKFTGRGLGMAAVLGIVRGHKGAIKVYSEPGRGTTFKVLLPASGRPAEIFNHDSHADEWRGKGKVLLVDDEETVRGIGKELLHELGFETITANDGREAIEIFKQTPDIAFVLLDLTMPHMDGEQCFRELKQLKPDVKVIMSSGYNEQEVTQKFVGKGLAGFIQKPYRLSVLKESLRKLECL
jgi:two-component system cell cycle sensor histidine kinase/response regulator CckA